MDFNFQDLILKDRDARQHQHYDVSFLEYLNMVKTQTRLIKSQVTLLTCVSGFRFIGIGWKS
jgi:hypothetical protein